MCIFKNGHFFTIQEPFYLYIKYKQSHLAAALKMNRRNKHQSAFDHESATISSP